MSCLSIYYDVKDWTVLRYETLSPELGGFDAVCIEFGYESDDWTECSIWGYMRKNIYEKLLNGEYSVRISRKTRFHLIVFDADGNPIMPHIDKLFDDGVY
jgi:hypothetical protein